MSEYASSVDVMPSASQEALFDLHDVIPEQSDRQLTPAVSPERYENLVVAYPEKMVDLQTVLRRRHSGRVLLSYGGSESDDEVTAHEDMGGGVRALRKAFDLQSDEHPRDQLIRTHRILPGDDIQDGINRLGLYQLMQTGIDAMTIEDKKTLARHYELHHDVLTYRPRAILLNDGDHPVLMNKYGNATQNELKQYADDLITFRNCLLTSGLTERLFNILGQKNTHSDARKRYIKRDLQEKGPIQIVFTTNRGGIVKPSIIRI